MDTVKPEQVVEALVAGGRLADAGRVAGAAAAAVAGERRPEEAARLRSRRADILLATGDAEAAMAEADAVLATAGLPPQMYDEATLSHLYTLLSTGRVAPAQVWAEAILAGRQRGGGDGALAGALCTLARLAWCQGRIGVAVGLARAAVERAGRACTVDHHPRLSLAGMLITLGAFDEAGALIEQAADGLARPGQALWRGAPELGRARLALATGRLTEGLHRAEAAVGWAARQGNRLLLPVSLATAALAALKRGEPAMAGGYVHRYRVESAGGHDGVSGATGLWARARLAEVRRGPAAAMRLLADRFACLAAQPELLMAEPSAAAWLTRVALAAGDRGRAAAAAAAARQLAEGNPDHTWPAAAAAHAEGLLDRDPGRLAEAAARYPQPWAAASAAEDAGALLAVQGEVRPAREALTRALSGYERIGAGLDAVRLRTRLAGTPPEGPRHLRRPGTASGWLSLTETERRVADLVAEGLTNAQVAERMFLSRHTIDFHLRKIFNRLDIRSRVELTRVALRAAEVRR
ncbi:helix-turn-helix domain-containing protein [Rhizomonospora bruguierae]|uniref:helix-turn-helix domain-containing protein n=1 Tax=Rhizomonospora bruguierae TaxID=1581705 RepID=UPI001BD05C4C|nr:helix-turn-helix transcriptional regulator [Micromonospora sp. NBRC 107566]